MADIELTVDMKTGRASRNAANLAKSIDKVSKRTKAMNANMTRFKTLSKFGGVGVAGSLAATAFAANKAVHANADFYKSLALTNTVLKLSDSQLKNLGDAITSIAIELGTSATSLAKWSFEAASAGHRGAALVQVLRDGAKVAVTGFNDVEVGGAGLIKAMDNFGVTSTEAFGGIAFASDKGVQSFEQISKAVADLGVTFSGAGLRFKDLLLAISAGSKTARPEQVIERTKALITSLTRPETIKNISKRLGGEICDVRDKGFVAVIKKLRQIDAEAPKQFEKLFGSPEAMQGARLMFNKMGEAAETIEDLDQSIKGFAAFGEEARVFARGPFMEMTKAYEEQQAVMRKLGEAFTPAYLETMKDFTNTLVRNKDGLIALGEMLAKGAGGTASAVSNVTSAAVNVGRIISADTSISSLVKLQVESMFHGLLGRSEKNRRLGLMAKEDTATMNLKNVIDEQRISQWAEQKGAMNKLISVAKKGAKEE